MVDRDLRARLNQRPRRGRSTFHAAIDALVFRDEQLLQHWQDFQRQHVKTGRVEMLLRITRHDDVNWSSDGNLCYCDNQQRSDQKRFHTAIGALIDGCGL